MTRSNTTIITRKTLAVQVAEVNRLCGRKSGAPGAFEIDYMQPGDSKHCYRLIQITEGGGERNVLGNARMNGRELLAALEGLRYGLSVAMECAQMAARGCS